MKEQIDEMTKVLVDYTKENHIMASHVILADYAEQLYNAGYRKQEWISVDERLPEDKQTCLAYGTVYYVPDENESKEILVTRFYKEFGFIDELNVHVTHWMPLPEPPKMKGGE